jgi:glycoprotein-N-acetylgalactosamine 3-beta-galactosyltransferase
MALLRKGFFNTVIIIILTCMALSIMVGIHRFRCNDKASSQFQNNRRQPRVFCFVLTAPKYFDTRARAVNSTWGRRCDGLFFITELSNDTQGLPIAPIANLTPGYEHLTQKTVLALQYAYEYHFNNFDWFVKADDDTYIFMENLKEFLRQQNTFEPVTFGWISKVCIFIVQRTE